MCFTAAKHQKWIVTDRKLNWNPSLNNEYPVATYAGYRTCSIEREDLVNLLRRVRARCKSVAEGVDAPFLKYSADAVFDGVLRYTCLKNHRLADCTFDFNEMVDEEGDTFIYLLRGRADIHRIIRSWNDTHDLEASDLILKNNKTKEEWEESEERMLEGHLLRFTEFLKKACLSVLPHMVCEYLYVLTKKFYSHKDFVCKAKYVAMATAVVMEKCFHLLGITRETLDKARVKDGYGAELVLSSLQRYNGLAPARQGVEDVVEPGIKRQKMDETEQTAIIQDPKFANRFITPLIVSGARDPARKSRFELFSIRPSITTDSSFKEGKLFGLISVSDKYGLRSDVGHHLFEPDFPYVPLFNFEWCDPVNMRNGWVLYIDNSSHSVPFSSSIEILLQLHVTTENKNDCFELANNKFELDLLDIWSENLNSKCGRFNFDGEDGSTVMYYILIKDAVDTVLEVTFNAGNHKSVYGEIVAYYGDFSYDCWGDSQTCYHALLFHRLIPNGTLPLKKSNLAVPKDASLIIEAYLGDSDLERVVLWDSHEFVPPGEDCISEFTLGGDDDDDDGTTCSLDLKVVWKY